MNVVVVGAGYVGLVTAACLAESGNRVLGVDHDAARVGLLQAGGVPIYEPGLEDMVRRNLQAGRLAFTQSTAEALQHADVVFIAVGTPPREDGSADLQHVLAVARQIGQHLHAFTVVVNKSTVPVGTAAAVDATVRAELEARQVMGLDFVVVSNPEFLKEGAAIEDFMRPDRIVIGVPDSPEGERARQVMTRLYMPYNRHHDRTVWMDVVSAELTKYAANAMLATRISFMNEMALLADGLGADIDNVRRGIGADQRIGHSFLYAGTGYGGSCFPKDTRALVHTAASRGATMRVVEAVESVNAAQKHALVNAVRRVFGSQLRGHRFAVWGLAFKPNTDDMREAPSRNVVAALVAMGAQVVAYDPVAQHTAHAALVDDLGAHVFMPGGAVQLAADPMQALDGADALLLVTEWKCFQNPDFLGMRERMKHAVVFDGRNVYDPATLQDMGVAYVGIGRRNALGQALMQKGPQGVHPAALSWPVSAQARDEMVTHLVGT
ncbi:MAG TPA: UDP-glucose/GDP-mannose dehydrogenase family protein [Burkholderiaceae bacterium]|nr:UDP-glucose/GDP-mannose dehydrogenase family protein [Burkholderiaceae bacterium]